MLSDNWSPTYYLQIGGYLVLPVVVGVAAYYTVIGLFVVEPMFAKGAAVVGAGTSFSLFDIGHRLANSNIWWMAPVYVPGKFPGVLLLPTSLTRGVNVVLPWWVVGCLAISVGIGLMLNP